MTSSPSAAAASPAPPRTPLLTLLFAFLGGVLAAILALPYVAPNAVPPLTPSTLPPKPIHAAVMGTVAHLDAVLNSLTPPNLLVFRHAMGYLHTVELYTAASLKLADAIAELEAASSSSSSPLPVPALALARRVTNCSAAPSPSAADCPQVALRLTRLLRACAAYGVFREEVGSSSSSSSSWRNTPLSQYLRADHPDSLRAVVLNFGGVQFKMMAELPEAIATGEASFQRAHGSEFWAWYEAHPTEHSIFDATMAQLGRLGGADAAIAHDVPWTSIVDVIVDVGGGFGEMTASIVRANPALEKGVVFDMPHVLERTARKWGKGSFANAGPAKDFPIASDKALAERIDLRPGDMFDPTTFPSVINSLERKYADRMLGPLGDPDLALHKCSHSSAPRHGYVLRDILHDWNDEDSVRILASLRRAMRANETVCYGSDGSKTVRAAPEGQDYKDRVLVVGRVIVPGAGFVQSMGTNDADMVMLGAFGTTAGERTVEHFSRLFAAADLELVAVHPTRSHYSVLEARARPTPPGWGYAGANLRQPRERGSGPEKRPTAAAKATKEEL
jgi:hypothetical protein